MTRQSGGTLLALVLLSAILTGCTAREPVKEPSRCQGCNVIFILIDTLRADHLGLYGYERDTSPALDTFGRQNLQFVNARSQAACTSPSVNSLLTSRQVFPFLEAETYPGIPPNIKTLPEVLKENGYATAAVSASPIVRSKPGKFNPLGGFGAGFDSFDQSCEWRRAGCVNKFAFEKLKQFESPFLLYLHYIDVHDPFNPPQSARLFSTPYEGEHDFIRDGDPNPVQKLIREGKAGELLDREDFDHLADLYDDEILMLDAELQKLFDFLERGALMDKTIVVIASDHGEEFFEHGSIKHCGTVFDTETRVPLLMRLPNVEPSGLRLEPYVQNLDVVPTLLDYLGIDVNPQWRMEGRSLRTLIETGQHGSEVRSYSTMGVYRSINDDRYKVILNLLDNSYQMFDLDTDPQEQTNILFENRHKFRRLRDQLLEWSRIREGDADERIKAAEEIEKELRSLGYLG